MLSLKKVACFKKLTKSLALVEFEHMTIVRNYDEKIKQKDDCLI